MNSRTRKSLCSLDPGVQNAGYTLFPAYFLDLFCQFQIF